MSVNNTHFGPERIASFVNASESGSVFFIGVGGVMMSSLALLTARRGLRVAGSDRTRTAVTESLEAAGVTLFYAHDASNLPPDCRLVVYTVAILPDNPEYVAAGERGIPCVSRADYLGWLMTGYEARIGVAGMHGKSTCTSMCAQIFMDAERDPTVLIGADYAPMGGAYRIGGEQDFLFEACEYMDSFLDFHPTVAVLLNAEWEHVDYFKSMEQILDSFTRFASLTGKDGVTVVNADDAPLTGAARRSLAEGGTGRVLTFGIKDTSADAYAENVHYERGLPVFTLHLRGEEPQTVKLSVPGLHQVYNALAAAAAAAVCGVPLSVTVDALLRFKGAGRRMEYRGDVNGAPVYDDYGHHPTEVRATLTGAAALTGTHDDGTPGELICVFQPHTYSRTAALYDQFLTAFAPASVTCLINIYAARETNTMGVSSKQLAADLGAHGRYCPAPRDAAEAVRSLAAPGDVVVIMGAGDVVKVTAELFGKK